MVKPYFQMNDPTNTTGGTIYVDDWSVDDVYNSTTGGGPPDTTAPATITDLAAGAPTSATVTLTWTAPGDDGSAGTAASYDVRYVVGTSGCSQLDSDGEFNAATQATGEPAPHVAGTAESFTVTGLSASTSYCFAVKTSDEIPNVSALSTPNPIGTTTGAGCGATLVQTATQDGSGTSTSKAFTSSNAAGNFVAVAIRAGAASETFTVSDSRGNTYRLAYNHSVSNDADTVALYYAENVGAGANTVTVSQTASASLRLVLMEFSGLALSSSLDGTPGVAEGSSTSPASASTTPVAARDLVVGAVSTAGGTTFTSGSGYTLGDIIPGAGGTKLATEYKNIAGGGAMTATASLGTTQPWTAGVAAFVAAACGGADVTAPSPVSNLAAASSSGTTMTLTWTAPGDDGATGTATAYDVRYRIGATLVESDWASATQVVGEPTPRVAGTAETMIVSGLAPGTQYTFAIKTSDEVPNTSSISNAFVASTTLIAPSRVSAVKLVGVTKR